MYKFREKLSRDITGNLTIHKRNKDGTEELWFDDHNVIVSGMSVALSLFFTGSGSTTITDYQIDRFQVGISGVPALPDASTTYQLSGPLDNETAYGGDSGDLYVRTAHQIKKGSITTGSIYALIPFSRVTRIDDTSVRYTIVLDEGACNDLKETDGGGNDNLDVWGGANVGVGVAFDNISGEGLNFQTVPFGLQMEVGLNQNQPQSLYMYVHSKQTLIFNQTGIQIVK